MADDVNELQNELEHNLNDTSGPISGSIFKSNPYKKCDVLDSWPNIIKISTDQTVNRNQNEYITQGEKPKLVVVKFADKPIAEDSLRRAKMISTQQLQNHDSPRQN